MLKRYNYNDRVYSLLQKVVPLEMGSMAEPAVRTLKACRRPGVHTSLQNTLLHFWTLKRALCLGAMFVPTYCVSCSHLYMAQKTHSTQNPGDLKDFSLLALFLLSVKKHRTKVTVGRCWFWCLAWECLAHEGDKGILELMNMLRDQPGLFTSRRTKTPEHSVITKIWLLGSMSRRLHSLPKLHYQVKTKCSNMWVYGEHSRLKPKCSAIRKTWK